MSDDDSDYKDKAVVDGTDTLAQGHGEPPADEAGITGGADADADGNPAFHGGGAPTGGVEGDPAAELPAHTAFEEGTTETVAP